MEQYQRECAFVTFLAYKKFLAVASHAHILARYAFRELSSLFGEFLLFIAVRLFFPPKVARQFMH